MQEIDEKEKILNCERMKSRKMNVEKGMYSWIPSGLLLVTFKGPNMPEKVKMYNGVSVYEMYIQGFSKTICGFSYTMLPVLRIWKLER